MSASVAVDMVSLTGENGICTSQRSPALSVSVGVMRQESCTNSEYIVQLAGAPALAEKRVLVRCPDRAPPVR